MRNTLADEMANVGKVWPLFEHTVQLLTAMQLAQVDDLNGVVNTLKTTLPTNPTVGNTFDWSPLVFTIVSDAMGALSYVPEAKIAQIWPVYRVGPGKRPVIASANRRLDFTTTIHRQHEPPPADARPDPRCLRKSLQLASERFTRIIRDARLLPIVGRLVATIWGWDSNDLKDLLAYIHPYNRIGSYQQLIGSLYQISEWVNYPLPAPALTPLPDLMGAPFHAYWVVPSPQGNGLHNIYIIHTPANSWGDTDWKVQFSHSDGETAIYEPQSIPGFSKPIDLTLYPTQEVIFDLFGVSQGQPGVSQGQLGVSRTDFFNCTNGWENIPLNLWIGLPQALLATDSIGDSV